MSFTTQCPKCRQPVLVPDGACADAIARCPLCTAEYSLGEVLAAAPPALIIVGMAAVQPPMAPAIAPVPAHMPPPPPSAPPEVLLAEPEPIPFQPEADVQPLAEHEPAFHGPEAEQDPWGASWKETGDTGEEGQAGGDGAFAESDDAVDFAAITGRSEAAAPAAAGAPADRTAPAAPRNNRRRSREPHPVRFALGLMISGALAIGLFYWGINFFSGNKAYDLAKIRLPGVPHTSQYFCWYWPFGEGDKNGAQANGVAVVPPGSEAKTEPAAKTEPGAKDEFTFATPNVKADVPEPKAKTEAAPEVKPEVTPEAKTEKTDDPFGTEPEAKTKVDLFAGDKTGEMPHEIKVPAIAKTEPLLVPEDKTEAKPEAKPAGKTEDEDPFAPSAKTAAKPEVTPEAKTEEPMPPAKTEDDPFAPSAKTAAKPEVKPESKTEEPKPPAKTEEEDPFAPSAKTAAKPEMKPEAKTDEPKPPAKTDEEDPFAPSAKTAAKSEVKPEAKTDEPKPPAKTEEPKPPAKTEEDVPAPPKTEAKTAAPAKTETKPADVIGPLSTPSFAAADLEKAVKDASAAWTDDVTPGAYDKLCLLAEVATCAKPDADAVKVNEQKQAAKDLVERVGKAAQGPEKVAGLAKKLLDDAASKGGILLSGTILKVGTKGGLHAAGVKVEGDKVVTVFGASALGAENDKVLVLGIIVREPAKNLGGYSGTQPMVIWAGMPVKLP